MLIHSEARAAVEKNWFGINKNDVHVSLAHIKVLKDGYHEFISSQSRQIQLAENKTKKKMGTFIKALAKYSFLINWKNISASVTTRRYLCSGESAEENLKSA